jgi:4-hydroxybenzoate polyprenyltransferase
MDGAYHLLDTIVDDGTGIASSRRYMVSGVGTCLAERSAPTAHLDVCGTGRHGDGALAATPCASRAAGWRWPVATFCLACPLITNNIEDLEADRISNPHRPLVQGRVGPRAYLWAGICSECVALALAFAADVRMGWGIFAISAGYYVYSCRPLRLKRVPILSKALIGFNSLSVAVCGYALAGGNWLEFPLSWLFFILIPLSLAANFVDLKDTAGDRAQGVATLPVLLGEATARHFIAAATLATYGMGALLLDIGWVYPLNVAGAGLHVYFLYRKPYDERWVFLILMGALVGLDGFLFWSEAVF